MSEIQEEGGEGEELLFFLNLSVLVVPWSSAAHDAGYVRQRWFVGSLISCPGRVVGALETQMETLTTQWGGASRKKGGSKHQG